MILSMVSSYRCNSSSLVHIIVANWSSYP